MVLLLHGKPHVMLRSYLIFIRKKGWFSRYQVRLLLGRHTWILSLTGTPRPLLGHPIFGTLVAFKIVNAMASVCHGSFSQPHDTVLRGQRSSHDIIILQFGFPPYKWLHQHIRKTNKNLFPQHPLPPQGFLQMLYEGVATVLYPVTPSVAFEWQAQDLDAKSQKKIV